MLALYSVLLVFFGLAALPYFLVRDLRTGKYSERLAERLGRLPATIVRGPSGSIWVHAVSVGEVQAAKTVVSGLKRAFPERKLFLSVTTLTGRRLAEEQLGAVDGVFQCPFDLGFAVRRVIRRIDPAMLVVVETELWPQLIEQCRAHGARCVLLNGRISDRSYPRYLRIRFFMRWVLSRLDAICVQNELYRERFLSLGAPPDRVVVTGSLKFDVGSEPPVPPAVADPIAGGSRVIIAGSTLAPEESLLLDAFEALGRDREHEDLRLVLAPRHPDRFDEVYELIRKRGLAVERRSALSSDVEGEAASVEADVVLLDSIGELAGLYRIAEIVFVGGSLESWGGHNIIEPAVFAKPILFGPHMENFRDIAAAFVAERAGIQLRDGSELKPVLEQLLRDPEEAQQMGARAKELLSRHDGAARRSVELLQRVAAGKDWSPTGSAR